MTTKRARIALVAVMATTVPAVTVPTVYTAVAENVIDEYELTYEASKDSPTSDTITVPAGLELHFAGPVEINNKPLPSGTGFLVSPNESEAVSFKLTDGSFVVSKDAKEGRYPFDVEVFYGKGIGVQEKVGHIDIIIVSQQDASRAAYEDTYRVVQGSGEQKLKLKTTEKYEIIRQFNPGEGFPDWAHVDSKTGTITATVERDVPVDDHELSVTTVFKNGKTKTLHTHLQVVKGKQENKIAAIIGGVLAAVAAVFVIAAGAVQLGLLPFALPAL